MPESLALRALLAVTLGGWFLVEVRRARHDRAGATRADRGSLTVLRTTTIGGFVAAVGVTLAFPAARIAPDAAHWCALAFLWCGISLRLWSFHTLGTYFTFTVQTSADQPMIASGPYRLVRHPSYLGMALALLGVALLLANWLALVVFAVPMLAGLAYRIRVEEQALEAELGDRWRSYATGRARLLPHVW